MDLFGFSLLFRRPMATSPCPWFWGRVCHMIREEVYSISGSLPLSIFSQIASRCLNSDLVILNGFVFKSDPLSQKLRLCFRFKLEFLQNTLKVHTVMNHNL